MRDILGGPWSEKFIIPSPLVFVFSDDGIDTDIYIYVGIDIDILRPRAAQKAIDTRKGGVRSEMKNKMKVVFAGW